MTDGEEEVTVLLDGWATKETFQQWASETTAMYDSLDWFDHETRVRFVCATLSRSVGQVVTAEQMSEMMTGMFAAIDRRFEGT